MKTCAIFTVFLLLYIHRQADAVVSSCYKCTGVCDRPVLERCPTSIGQFSCYSAKISQPPSGQITYSKGCAVSNALSVCSVINRKVLISCYYCKTNNCNNHD